MKKNCLVILISALIMIIMNSCGTYDNHRGAIRVNNSWSSWRDLDNDFSRCHAYGDYDDITFKDENGYFLFRFKIIPGQTFYKQTKVWTKYSGTMEYYVSDNYPTIHMIFNSFFSAYSKIDYLTTTSDYYYKTINPFLSSEYGKVKRTANATIMIAPYKKHPKVYNIHFDDVSFGFDMGQFEFKKSSWLKQFDKPRQQKSYYNKTQDEIYE